jgi:hypothetical protein
MKKFILIPLAINLTIAWANITSAVDVTVDSMCNIYGAGHPSPPNNAPTVGPHGGGVPPVLIIMSALNNAPWLQFYATGTVAYCPSCGNYGPDGNNLIYDAPSYNGISGITNGPGRGLVAVFTSETEPANPAPAALNFGIIGTNYATLAPQLRQVFFIGNGLTGSGSAQAVRVPAGATRLYLGLVDGYSYDDTPDGYQDNSGAFSVSVNPALFLGIDYATLKPGISVFGPVGSSNRIEYTTVLPATSWVPLTNVVITNIPTMLYDPSASGDSARFYRAFRWP